MKYSFIDPIKESGETEQGLLYDIGYTEEELEAKVDTLIDPTLDQDPHPSDPPSIYPKVCGDDPEMKRLWEIDYIAMGFELPPLRLLPENSLLREEWFRRAEILKQERKRFQAK